MGKIETFWDNIFRQRCSVPSPTPLKMYRNELYNICDHIPKFVGNCFLLSVIKRQEKLMPIASWIVTSPPLLENIFLSLNPRYPFHVKFSNNNPRGVNKCCFETFGNGSQNLKIVNFQLPFCESFFF